jgi:hypothetical protein
MGTAYHILRISISMVNIAIIVMIILAAWPFVTGDFGVDVPTQSDVSWSYDDGNITVSAPIGIRNGGFYDINDVNVTMSVKNETHYSIVDSFNNWGTISAGSHVTRSVVFTVDLKKLVADGSSYMVFHRDSFVVDVEISAKYLLGLIQFTADYQVVYGWDGLILGMGFLAPSLYNDTGTYGIKIPYWLNTNRLLVGLGGDYSVSLKNGIGNNIANTTQHVDFGKNYSSNFSLNMNPLAAFDLLMNNQTLTATVTVKLGSTFQITTVRQIHWVAPMHW